MMFANAFAKNIRPVVEAELTKAKLASQQDDFETAFTHLENAHVLGQESTYWHVKVHMLMLAWGVRQRSVKEVAGQAFRMVGAASTTALGLVPIGNTGGSNVSPFKVMPVRPEYAELIAAAKREGG